MRIWTTYLKMKFYWNIMKAHNTDTLSSALLLKLKLWTSTYIC